MTCPCPSCRNIGPDHEADRAERGRVPTTRPFKSTPFAEWWNRHWNLTLTQARTQYQKEMR